MSLGDRDKSIASFLDNTAWSGWRAMPIAGDASQRRYIRLIGPGDQTAIVMDAILSPPSEIDRFCSIAHALRQVGLAAPDVMAADIAKGLLLIEDLGPTDVALHLTNVPNDEERIYSQIVDILAKIQDISGLNLKRLDAELAAEWLAPLGDFWGKEQIDISVIQGQIKELYQRMGLVPDRLALRDFHSQNLIWRPEKKAEKRVGLLDFQDAIFAPMGYDLASLLRDARRDVSDTTVTQMTRRFALLTDRDPDTFAAEIAFLATQRNLRILGILAKLAKQDEGDNYGTLIPRVWSQLQNDLSHPALRGLQRAVSSSILPPQQSAKWGW